MPYSCNAICTPYLSGRETRRSLFYRRKKLAELWLCAIFIYRIHLRAFLRPYQRVPRNVILRIIKDFRRVTRGPLFLLDTRAIAGNFDCVSPFGFFLFLFESSSRKFFRVFPKGRGGRDRRRRSARMQPGPEVAGDLGRSFKWNLRRVHLLFYVSAHDQCW